VEVELTLSDCAVDLIGEGGDVAIRVAHALPESSFVATRLAAFERVLVAAPIYLERRGEPQHPRDRETDACVRFLQLSNPDVWMFERDGVEVSVRVPGPLSTGSSLAMVDTLVDGIGIALIPAVAVATQIEAGQLRCCLRDWQPRARSVFAVYPTRRHLDPRVRAFVDFIRSAFASELVPDS
jgi:DNA-binding transcriptional LysR family regulator